MKIRLLAAAVCATVCTGCNTANLLSSRLGQGHEEKFSQFAETADGADSGTPRLPPPTNRDPRPSVELTNTVDEHVRLGETELRDQRLTQAQSHFEQALIAQPQHAKANHRMGVVCDKLGQYERAEKHYLLALQHDPRNVAVLSDLGYSYWLQKRYAESERHLLEARSIDPNYETAVANLGMLYGTTGRTDEALVLFRQIGDETQVQQIMQQVTALAARDHAPAQSAGPMTPAALAANIPTEKTNPFEATRDLSGVNAPTRELLELMEQGRRQQQRPESVQQASWTPQAEPPSAPAVPPFAQQRPAAPQPRPPQMAGVNPFHNPSPAVRPTGPAQVPNHLLNQALSQIDREGRTVPSGPISIGPPVRPQQTLGSNSSPQSASAANGVSSGSPPIPLQQFATATHPSRNDMPAVPQYNQSDLRQFTSPAPTHDAAGWNNSPSPQITSSAPPATSEFATRSPEPRNGIAGESPAWDESLPVPQTSRGYDNLSQVAGAADPRPSSNGGSSTAPEFGREHFEVVQQASAAQPPIPMETWAGAAAAATQQPVEHAYHQQQPGSAAPIDLLHGQTNGWNTMDASSSPTVPLTTPGGEWPPGSATDAKTVDSYQEARRKAALMGLGAGPGQMFPYVSQTARSAPGSDSRWNGAQYPPPERQLSAGMTSANLAPAFQDPQAANLTPGPNHQGQSLPQVAAPVNQPAQYGAASSGAFQQLPQSGNSTPLPANPLGSYEQARLQQSGQLNGLINQTYGQPPQSPPYNAAAPQSQLANAPAGGAPAPPAGNIWDLRPSTSTASTPTAAPTPQGTPRRNDATPVSAEAVGATPPRATNMSTVVIPEPYRKPGAGSWAPNYGETNSSPEPSYGTSSGGPVIVPKYR